MLPLPLGVPGSCALAPLALARDGSGKTQTSGEKNQNKTEKGLLLQYFQPIKPGVGILRESQLSQNPRPRGLDKQPQDLHPPPTKILMVLEEHGSLALLAAGACRGAQHPQAGSWSRHLGRQPGQRCSTKPSSLHVALAAITFPMSFAADSHLANAFPQLSDFKVVRGHFAPEQTPLKTPGSVSIPSSKHLLPAFSPCPAAGSQW